MAPLASRDKDPRPLLEIGRVARSHGLVGEVVVALVTNRIERLAPGAELTLRPSRRPSDPSERTSSVVKVRSSKPFQGRYLVQFEGVHTREAADELREALLFAPAVEDPDSLFVHDLVGSEVVELNGAPRGTVVAVQANPASDLLVLDDGNLVPLRFVVRREPGLLVIDVPAGLFD
ncbi:MAG: ribosome maturation factor RimM [Acidimicrobiales bacterium]